MLLPPAASNARLYGINPKKAELELRNNKLTAGSASDEVLRELTSFFLSPGHCCGS